MPSQPKVSRIQVDPLDLEKKTPEERLQLALNAIALNGFRSNGRPWLSLREAAAAFNISKTTLTARFNGRKGRHESHIHQQALSPGAEDALKAWIKEMGRRGVPLHPSAVAQQASAILGTQIGEHWVHRFRTRHPDLKAKWTTNLEHCRAQALNPTAVAGFYDVLKELQDEYQFEEDCIYNMDEKGIQQGVGKKVLALVDRDQKIVQQVEDGNRELVTIIECVCADGTAIPPSVVFQGARRDLEWGRDNPCNARYAARQISI